MSIAFTTSKTSGYGVGTINFRASDFSFENVDKALEDGYHVIINITKLKDETVFRKLKNLVNTPYLYTDHKNKSGIYAWEVSIADHANLLKMESLQYIVGKINCDDNIAQIIHIREHTKERSEYIDQTLAANKGRILISDHNCNVSNIHFGLIADQDFGHNASARFCTWNMIDNTYSSNITFTNIPDGRVSQYTGGNNQVSSLFEHCSDSYYWPEANIHAPDESILLSLAQCKARFIIDMSAKKIYHKAIKRDKIDITTSLKHILNETIKHKLSRYHDQIEFQVPLIKELLQK